MQQNFKRISLMLLIGLAILLSCKKEKITFNSEDVVGTYCGRVFPEGSGNGFFATGNEHGDSPFGEFIIKKTNNDLLVLVLPSIFLHDDTDSLFFMIRDNSLQLVEQSYEWINYCGSDCVETIKDYYSGSGNFNINENKIKFEITVKWKDYILPFTIEMVKSNAIEFPRKYVSIYSDNDIVYLSKDEFSDSLSVSIISDKENFIDESLMNFKIDNSIACNNVGILLDDERAYVYYSISYTDRYLYLHINMRVYYEDVIGYYTYPTYVFDGVINN